MHDLIYYPGFEVRDSNWLKFALLYLDCLRPIIPRAGDIHITEQSRQLANDSDLIAPHRPTYDEGDNATRDALEQLEKVLQHPERYYRIFGDGDFVERWRTPGTQTSTLFRDKYTDQWEHFCTTNQIGHESERGLCIPSDVVLLYMTILAQTISDANAVSPITDRRTLDRFSIFTRRTPDTNQETVNTAQGVFDLVLPQDLSDISVETVIRHRNRPGYREKQKAFHRDLNAFMDNYNGDDISQSFINNLGSSWQDFSNDLVSVGSGVAVFGLGVWLLADSGTASFADAVKEIVGGLTLTVGSIIPIRNTWNHTQTKRFTRKFLSDLQSLAPVTTG